MDEGIEIFRRSANVSLHIRCSNKSTVIKTCRFEFRAFRKLNCPLLILCGPFANFQLRPFHTHFFGCYRIQHLRCSSMVWHLRCISKASYGFSRHGTVSRKLLPATRQLPSPRYWIYQLNFYSLLRCPERGTGTSRSLRQIFKPPSMTVGHPANSSCLNRGGN